MLTAKSKNHTNLYLVLVILGMGLALRMSVNIWRVYHSGQRLVLAQNELDRLTSEQETLQKTLSYVQTPEFVEKEAREKLGYGREGETVLIMPKFADQPKEVEKLQLSPWQQWRKLYIGLP